MVEISFEIGGRKINPNQIGNAIEKAVLQQVTEKKRKGKGTIRGSNLLCSQL